MKNDKRNLLKKLLIAGTAVAAAATAAAVVKKVRKDNLLAGKDSKKLPRKKNIYIDGRGISSLAAAVFLITDGMYEPSSIHIYGLPDTSQRVVEYGNAQRSFRRLMGLMDAETQDGLFVADMLENMRFSAVPEIKESDRNGNISPMSLKPSKQIMRAVSKCIARISRMSEDERNNTSIMDCFADVAFFETDLYLFIETVFSIKPEYKVSELIKRIELLTQSKPQAMGALSYELSVAGIIGEYLTRQGVSIMPNALINSADISENGRIAALNIDNDGTKMTIYLNKEDMLIVTAGDIYDGASCGDFSNAAPASENLPLSELWLSLSENSSQFGLPLELYEKESPVMEFSIKDDDGYLLDKICSFADADPKNGVSVVFGETPWKMMLTSAPYSKNEEYEVEIEFDDEIDIPFPMDDEIEQPYINVRCIRTDIEGDFIDKTARTCTGVELLYELCMQMGLTDEWDEILEHIDTVLIRYYPYMNASMRTHSPHTLPSIRPCSNCILTGAFVNTEDVPAASLEQEIYSAQCAANILTGKKTRKVKQKKINLNRI